MKPYYQDHYVRLYHGDCLDVLSTLALRSLSGFVTDPPYTAAGGSTNGRSAGHDADTQFFRHWATDVFKAVRSSMRTDACGFAFCDWRTVNVLGAAFRSFGDRQKAPSWEMSQALVWDRESIGLGSPFRSAFEMIGFFRGPDFSSRLPKNIPSVIHHRWPFGAKEHHPAEKPVSLLVQLARWVAIHGDGSPLLDPFAGSGSTLIACRRIGQPIIGIEIEERYCEIAAQRMSQEVLPLSGSARGEGA